MLTVSIVVYKNDENDLRQILKSLSSNPYLLYIYVVDNSPTDGLSNVIERSNAKIKYTHNPSNPGYGSSHNIAIHQSVGLGAKYHVVINPDIEVSSEAVDLLYAFMESNPDIGLVMPKIIYKNGNLQYLCKKLPTPMDLIGRRFLIGPFKKMINERVRKYELRHKDYNRQMDVPSLSGCFMFLRTDVLKRTGGFDERYFMYLEDVDLCRRIGEISRTVYYPRVAVIHGYAKESYKNGKLLFYHIHSAIKYFNKWGWVFDAERKRVNSHLDKREVSDTIN